MAKKRLDFKALILNHGEKFGAAVIGVLAVTGLATANWSACSRLESELKDAAMKTKDSWNSPANVISEEKKALFDLTPDVEVMAKRMASPNEDIEQFAWVRHLNEPIIRLREKLAPVVVLPPESPESTLVTFALVQKPDEEEVGEEEMSTEMPEEAEDVNAADKDLADLFGDNKKSGAGVPGAFPGGEGTTGSPQASLSGMPASGYVGGAEGLTSSGGAGMGMGMMMGGSGMMEGLDGYGSGGYTGGYTGMEGAMGAAAAVERKVRSCAGVSVRCVFDLYKQTNMLAEALHIPAKDGQRYIDFVNLEIQRKAAVDGTDPWVGEWEPLPLKDLAEILEEAAYNDRDIVNPSVVRSEITMPLPARAAGNWTPANASHKRLEEFQLSDEEQDLIDRHQAKLLEEANKQKAMLPPQQAKSEGFRRWGLASQDLGTALGGGMNVSGSMFSDYQSSLNGVAVEGAEGETTPAKKDPRFKTKEDLEKFLNNTLVANRLLLVRFMDFTCDRGNSYRYRVRLEMRNPAFNMPVDELEQPELASQKTIFSAWSEPTQPVFVPGSYRYYTQEVDSRPRSDEVAKLSMFYQHETAGTPVMARLEVPVGVRIGGKQNIEVVDLGKSTLEAQEIELKSLDYLASVTEAPRMSASEFPEMKDILKGIPSGKKIIPDRISVVDSTGAIVSRYVGDKVDGGNKAISEADDIAVTKFVLDTYKHFRPQEAAEVTGFPYGAEGGTTSDSGMGAGMMGSGMMMGMGSEYAGSSGPGSSLGSSRSSRSSGRRGKGSRPGGSSSSGP
jgi:hypothetical protein